ncbi:phage tail tape measure protein, TP901 family [Methanocaldococcus vulcanius M7]|uniref:Phage tail tape measure protein, TP901 family n=1 Tax=Methanocaldococcus vulcanius (strain ATCC 700851 / DSM 12094 / M7) TaxID=579137 RepID=C9RFS8_METVM|nr:phage tail tape measure protein, TP901 family [Methanocaldococcus vulcanius M7]
MADTNLQIIITAVDKATAVFQKIQQNIDRLENRVKNMADVFDRVGKSMAMVGAGVTAFSAPFVAGMYSAIQTGIEFEQQMYKIKAITGATAEEFEKLTQTAMQMGAQTAYTASEAAEAMYLMASAGMKTNEIIAAIPNVLHLATVAQTDLSTATDLVVSTLNSFGMSAQESGRAVDVFVQACANSPATVEKLQYSLKYAAPAARALGLSLEDTVAALMMFYKAGRRGEDAGTGLREVLTELADTKVQKALEQYGIKVMDASGKLRNLGDILDDIKKKGLSATEIFKIFGTEAGSALLQLMQQGGDAYKEYVRILENSAGVAEQKYREMTNTVEYKIQQLKSAIENIKLEIFKDSKGNIKEFLDMLIKAMPAIKEFAVSVAQGMATVGKIILMALKPILDIFNKLPTPIKHAIGAFVGLAAAVAAIVGPIILLAGAFAMAISSTLEIVSVIGALGISFGAIAGAVSAAIGAIGAFIAAIAPITAPILAIVAVLAVLYLAWKNNWFGIRDIVNSAISAVKQKLTLFINGIKWLINQIKTHKTQILEALKYSLLGPWGLIKLAWDKNLFGIRDKLKNIMNEIINFLKSLPSRFYQAGVGLITEFIRGFTSKINEIKQKILDLLSWIDDHLPHSPAKEGPLSRLDKVGPGFIETIAEGIEKHKSRIQAAVGKITTTMAINPKSIPISQQVTTIQNITNSSPNINVNIHVSKTDASPEDIALAVQKVLKQQLTMW